jgi:hypothetical protein
MHESSQHINSRVLKGARHDFQSLFPPGEQQVIDSIYPYVIGWVLDGLNIEQIRSNLQEMFPNSLEAFDTFTKPPKKTL